MAATILGGAPASAPAYRQRSGVTGQRNLTNPLSTTANSAAGVAVSAPSSGGYSAWVQLLDAAALSEPYLLLTAIATPQNNSALVGLEIATGAAASELVVAEFVYPLPTGFGVAAWSFLQVPLLLPALTRISARVRTAYTTNTNSTQVALHGVPLSSLEAF